MKTKHHQTFLNILLADDDTDDCFFFNKALQEIPIATRLTTVHDGEKLMDYLFENSEQLPDILFLDLSMPRKTGFECLTEIKEDERLKNLTVVVFSTSYTSGISFEQELINTLYKIGAHHYIRKPGDFMQLKQVIHDALSIVAEKKLLSEQGDNL